MFILSRRANSKCLNKFKKLLIQLIPTNSCLFKGTQKENWLRFLRFKKESSSESKMVMAKAMVWDNIRSNAFQLEGMLTFWTWSSSLKCWEFRIL